MAQISCSICLEDLPLTDFRFFSCGHGWCQGCISRLQPRKPCPHCKRPLGGEKPHPIFPNIINIASDDRSSEAGPSSGKVKAKADPVQVLIDEVQSDISTKINETISKAIRSKIEKYEWEISLLRGENSTLGERVADLVAKVNSGSRLKEELAAERQRYNEYRQSTVGLENENFRLKAQISSHDAEMFQLYNTITRLNDTVSKKDAEVEELKKQKEDLEKRIKLNRKKMTAMAQQAKRKVSGHRPMENPDDSLLVDRTNALHIIS